VFLYGIVLQVCIAVCKLPLGIAKCKNLQQIGDSRLQNKSFLP